MTYATRLMPPATYTAKYDAECTDYPKRASSHRNYFTSDYLKQDTARARSHQDIENTTGDPSASHWLWMTSVLNTSMKPTSTIFSKHLSKTVKLKKTGKELGTLASHSIGTTRNVKSICPCQAMLNVHSHDLDI